MGGSRAGDGGLPHPKQQRFLLHADTKELFYGGAGGGGKSQAAWYGALQFADTPGYAALIFRRTYADLALPGALMSRAKQYLAQTGAVWHEGQKTWTFPSGATITFAYLENENDKYRYASAEFQYIFFDELTHFTESQYTFLFTRLRKKTTGGMADVPLRMRAASNPGGPGHDWVKKRFIDPVTRDPKRIFIPATMEDNPTLDIEGYEDSLSNTDPLTRAQIKKGDWDAVAGGRFRKEWFGWYRRDPQQPDFLLTADGERFLASSRPKFQTCDPSASESNQADYFVLSTWCLSPKAKLLWLGCERRRMEIPEQVETCQASYRRWNPQWVAVEEVLNQRALAQLLRRSTTPAMVVRGVSPLGRDKLARATGGINLAHSGRVLLPEDNPAFPLDDVIGELTRFTGDPDQDAHDDIVDTLSYAAELLPGMETGGRGGSGPSGYKPKGVGATSPLGGGAGGVRRA